VNAGIPLELWGALLENLAALVYMAAYVMGVMIFMGAMMRVSRLGRREFSSNARFRESPAGILADMFVGAALVYLVSTLDMLSYTLFDSPHTSLTPEPGANATSAARALLIGFAKVFGLIAVVRGVLQFSKIGEQTSQGQSYLTSGIWFLVSGTALLQIDRFAGYLAELVPGLKGILG
jgi:hypothetical protein